MLLSAITSPFKRVGYLLQGIHAYPVRVGDNLFREALYFNKTSATDPQTLGQNLVNNLTKLPHDTWSYLKYSALRWTHRKKWREICGDEFITQTNMALDPDCISKMGPLQLSLMVGALKQFINDPSNLQQVEESQPGKQTVYCGVEPVILKALKDRTSHLLLSAKTYLQIISVPYEAAHDRNIFFGLLATFFDPGYFNLERQQLERPDGWHSSGVVDHFAFTERMKILEELNQFLAGLRSGVELISH